MAINLRDEGNTRIGNSADKTVSQPSRPSKDAATRQREYERIQAERARQARITELKSQIEDLNLEIKELKEKKEQYDTMKGQVGQAISQLDGAVTNMASAESGLDMAYKSSGADEGISQIKGEMSCIKSCKNTLSGVIIPAINIEIEKLNILITNKQTRLGQMKSILSKL